MKKISFGIDIGGINSAIGIVDESGKIYSESVVSTKAYPYFDQYPAYVDAIEEAMNALLGQLDFEYSLVGIGIGAPNASYNRGTIEQPANLWKYRPEEQGDETLRIFPLVEDLRQRFSGCICAITNDANAATLGEMIFGAARGMCDFSVITLGTGLGSGFVAGGEMIYGLEGFAGEYGHVIVERGGRDCGCGRKGCLETYCSATGICRTAAELMSTMRESSVLRDIPYNKLDSLQISKAAAAGDPIACEAFRYTAEMLGRALADLISIFTPEAIILFGGLAKAGDILFEPTKKYMDENTFAPLRGKTKLLPSGVQEGNIAVMGAAALAWKEISKRE